MNYSDKPAEPKYYQFKDYENYDGKTITQDSDY